LRIFGGTENVGGMRKKPAKASLVLVARGGPVKIRRYFWRPEMGRQNLVGIFDGQIKPPKITLVSAAIVKTGENTSSRRKTVDFL
jgi:hypothetical protein